MKSSLGGGGGGGGIMRRDDGENIDASGLKVNTSAKNKQTTSHNNIT